MLLNKYNLINNKEIYTLILLILFSISIRIPFVAVYGDGGLQNEWNALVLNLVEYKQLGWINCQFAYYTTKVCFEEGVLLPNLWMPPLYAYYLYFFKFLNLSEQNYILLILSSQIFIGAISVAVFYKINKIFFSNKLSLYSSLLFSIFPLYIYASVQISSISLQVFLTVLFFYFFFQLVEKRNSLSIVFFSFTAGLLILLRGEFYAILILTIFYLFFIKINIKKILLIVLITSITISPYLIRNVLIFEKITMMKSFGYNIWKGNHPYAMKNSIVAGSEIVHEDFQKQLDEVPRDKFLRFNFEKLYLDKAVKNIKEEPKEHLIFFLKKAVSFLLIDFKSLDPNYYNPIHYFPVLLLGVTSLIGISLSDKKSYKLNYLILILFAYVFIFSTVSILPRYKLIILPIQIILTSSFIQYVINKLKRQKKT